MGVVPALTSRVTPHGALALHGAQDPPRTCSDESSAQDKPPRLTPQTQWRARPEPGARSGPFTLASGGRGDVLWPGCPLRAAGRCRGGRTCGGTPRAHRPTPTCPQVLRSCGQALPRTSGSPAVSVVGGLTHSHPTGRALSSSPGPLPPSAQRLYPRVGSEPLAPRTPAGTPCSGRGRVPVPKTPGPGAGSRGSHAEAGTTCSPASVAPHHSSKWRLTSPRTHRFLTDKSSLGSGAWPRPRGSQSSDWGWGAQRPPCPRSSFPPSPADTPSALPPPQHT